MAKKPEHSVPGVTSSGKEQETARSGEVKMSRRSLLRRTTVGVGGLALAGGLGSALGACTASSGPPAGTSAAAASPSASAVIAPTTIKLMSWFWAEPGRNAAWRAMVDKFHKAQNAVRVEEVVWPFPDFEKNVIVQLQAGRIEGDIIQTTPELGPRLLRAGQLEPIEDVATAAGISSKLTAAHRFMRKDNHLYGLDGVSVPVVIIYNQKRFADAGLAVPKTVDEWVDVTRRLTDRPNRFGIFAAHIQSEIGLAWAFLQGWILPFDGVWATGKTPMVTSDPVIRGLKLFHTMYEAGMPKGTDRATATKMLEAGQLAQMVAATATINVVKTNAPATYPNMQTMTPPWPNKKFIVRLHPVTVNAKSEKKDAAKTFLKFLFSPDNYPELLEKALDPIPAFAGGASDAYVKSLPWMTGVNAGTAVTPPELVGDFITVMPEFGQIVVSNLIQTLTAGRSVEESMAAAQKDLVALAARSL